MSVIASCATVLLPRDLIAKEITTVMEQTVTSGGSIL